MKLDFSRQANEIISDILLQEAIESFKDALKQKVDFIDAYKSLGQAYR